jgi:anti-sigma factor RsiW
MSGFRSGDLGCPEQGPWIAALLDGELQPDEQQRLSEHLAGCDRCAEEMAEQVHARAALHAMAAALQAPPDLRLQIEQRRNDTRTGPPRWRGALLIGSLAAAIAFIAALALARAMIRVPSDAQIASAARAHTQETLAAAPVAVRSADPDAVTAWIQRQTGQRIEAVSFATDGYQLLGARLEPSLGPRAISIVYDGPNGRLTCVVLPEQVPAVLSVLLATEAPAIRATHLGNSTGVSWADRDAAYILIGPGDAQALLQLARVAAQSS